MSLPSLTSMRWWAALLVFLHHIRGAQLFGGDAGLFVERAFAAGHVGVSFFFILSGVVLAWSAGEAAPTAAASGLTTAGPAPARDTHSAHTTRAATFWQRRFARVYPLHVATAAAALLLAVTVAPSLLPDSPQQVLSNLLLVHTWDPSQAHTLNPVAWSLACEAFFYASFPALHGALRARSDRFVTLVAASAVAVTVALPTVWAAAGPDWSPIAFPPARLPEFVVGVTVGVLLRRGAWRGPGIAASAAVTAVGYVFADPVARPFSAYAAWTVLGLTLLIAAAATRDLERATAGTTSPRRLLNRLGEWSFAFYLVHILVLRAVEHTVVSHPRLDLLPALGLTVALLAGCLALSAAAHHGVEHPARRALLAPRRALLAPRGALLAHRQRTPWPTAAAPFADPAISQRHALIQWTRPDLR